MHLKNMDLELGEAYRTFKTDTEFEIAMPQAYLANSKTDKELRR